MRNKITSLERQIINLKEENRALVIKIKQGIEAVENHMHNLPCEKEKELKQALHRCQINLDKEMEMRKSLEKNVAETMMNFNRLFEEAEIARQIVIKKLKDI